jgi:hypothetical protein
MRGLLIVTFLIASFRLAGQGVQFGIKGGPSIYKAKTDIYDGITHTENSHKTNLGLGYNFGFLMTSNATVGYDLELGLVSKSFNQKGASSGINVLYLELPIHLKVQVLPQLDLFIGPEFSYRLSSFLFTSFQYGLSGGAMYKLSDKWGLRLRYDHSLNISTEYDITDVNGSAVGVFQAYHTGVSFSGVYYIN